MVRARSNHDLLLRRTIDHHKGDAGGRLGIARDELNVDFFGAKEIEQFVARFIASHPPNEGDARAEPGRSHRLIGSFAAAGFQKFKAINRLTGFGQGFTANEIIDVGASKHDDVDAR